MPQGLEHVKVKIVHVSRLVSIIPQLLGLVLPFLVQYYLFWLLLFIWRHFNVLPKLKKSSTWNCMYLCMYGHSSAQHDLLYCVRLGDHTCIIYINKVNHNPGGSSLECFLVVCDTNLTMRIVLVGLALGWMLSPSCILAIHIVIHQDAICHHLFWQPHL